MKLIILKITEPHGWVIAEKISQNFSSFLNVSYSKESYYNFLSVNKSIFTLEELQEAIIYWFSTNKYKKENLLLLTEDDEIDNSQLIKVLQNIPLNNYCILICNDFMKKYFSSISILNR